MNKLKTIIIAFFLGSISTVTFADWKAGITLSGAEVSPTAKEEAFGPGDNESRSEDLAMAFGSIFIEKNIGFAGISLGLDVVPYNLESEKVTNTRTDDGINDAADDDGTTEVDVEIEIPVTLYASVPLGSDGVYAKLGASYANVKTLEKTINSTTYPDAELYGGHLSLGFEKDTGQGFGVRVEAGYSMYTNITSISSSRRTKVHIDGIEGAHAKLSIVKSF